MEFEPKASAKTLVLYMIYGERDSPPSHVHFVPFVFSPWIALLSQANARVINKFCGERDWIRNLAVDPATASNTSICLTLDLEKD